MTSDLCPVCSVVLPKGVPFTEVQLLISPLCTVGLLVVPTSNHGPRSSCPFSIGSSRPPSKTTHQAPPLGHKTGVVVHLSTRQLPRSDPWPGLFLPSNTASELHGSSNYHSMIPTGRVECSWISKFTRQSRSSFSIDPCERQGFLPLAASKPNDLSLPRTHNNDITISEFSDLSLHLKLPASCLLRPKTNMHQSW